MFYTLELYSTSFSGYGDTFFAVMPGLLMLQGMDADINYKKFLHVVAGMLIVSIFELAKP